MGKRLRSFRRPRMVEAAQISFTGMRDSIDPTTASNRKAFRLENVYPQDPEVQGALLGRPGFTKAHSVAVTGTPSIRHITTFVQNDGTRHTVLFAGNKMYELDWGTGTLTDKTGTMTLSSTAEIFTVPYKNGLIINDGVNPPYHWDGASTITDLTTGDLGAGFVAFGQPVVYYAKLFFINAVDRTEIVWSEENSILLGFTGGATYNNGWNLIQTNQSPLMALAPTEQALYYFRDDAIGAVLGEVTTNFASTGVQDAISASIGTEAPGSVLVVDRDIFFLDQYNRPQHFPVGGTLTPNFFDDARETIRLLDTSEPERHRAVYWPHADLVLFGVESYSTSSSDLNQLMAFHRQRREFVGIWTGFDFHALALVQDSTGVDRLAHGSPTDGFMYYHGTPDGTIWSDGLDAGEEGILHVVDGSAIGNSLKYESHWSRLDMLLRELSSLTGATLQLRSPEGTVEMELATLSTGGALWDQALWDQDEWAAGEADVHVTAQFSINGRWLRARLEHDTVNEQFGFMGWQLTGYRRGLNPEVR